MIAIIGGSQAYRLLELGSFEGRRLGRSKTPFGESAPLHHVQGDAGEFLFMPRHGEAGKHRGASFVNYRANIYALKDKGVESVVAWSGPGAIDPCLQAGQLVVPNDVIDETRSRESTFFDASGVGFIRMRDPFCPRLRDALVHTAAGMDDSAVPEGVYVCTEGPRMETPAEIRKYEMMGASLVGMTLCPEMFLARELEMCYAAICFVTNNAEGVVDALQDPSKLFEGLATDAEREAADAMARRFPELVQRAIAAIPEASTPCTCAKAMQRFKARGDLSNNWREWVKES